jgi:hypothetical protein
LNVTINAVTERPPTLGIYAPVIPLDLSPLRFRVLVPLAAASTCVDAAIAAWKEDMARVWDRLPLRVGLLAFARKTPFQGVIEAARNVEHALDDAGSEQRWRVIERSQDGGLVTVRLARPDGGCETRIIPVHMPDGRGDVYYPYLRVSDDQSRFPLDFAHPGEERRFRHATDLRHGDDVFVAPSAVATLFLDSTARRFDPIVPRPLADWERMRSIWQTVRQLAPSASALRSAWSDVLDRAESWRGPDGEWLTGGHKAWLDFARASFAEGLNARGRVLEDLVEAAKREVLGWSLEWHNQALKQSVEEINHA